MGLEPLQPADFSDILPSGDGGVMYEAFKALGGGMMKAGNSMMKMAVSFWGMCCDVAVKYLKISPKGTNAFTTVSGTIFSVFLAVAASLVVLFFLLGWLNETIDINKSFTLENMFRFFVRYVITASLIVNSLSLVRGTVDCSTALVSVVNVSDASMKGKKVENVFKDLKESMEDEEATGTEWLGTGIISMIAGLFGGIVILVCGVQLILAVLSRLFKMYLCIPFGPVALSSFAGGQTISQTGISWIRTFLAYALEAVVIALAIRISFGLFSDGAMMAGSGNLSGALGAILTIVEYCLPMITACACVKGAEATIRRCLGLG